VFENSSSAATFKTAEPTTPTRDIAIGLARGADQL
jgi:hypothetical protein